MSKSKYITPAEAVELTAKAGREVTTVTIRTWCETYDLGKKFVGRWLIDREKFEKFLKEESNG